MISFAALFEDFEFFLETGGRSFVLETTELAFIFPGWQQLSKHVSEGFKNIVRDRTKTFDVLELAILNEPRGITPTANRFQF